MSAMTWILQHLHYIHNHKRRKGRGRRGPWPLHTFWNSTFFYYISSTKGCLLSFERKKWNFNIFANPTKILGFIWKILLFPPLVHNVWLTTDNWWTTVLWSGSTKLCNSKHFRWFTLKNFFGLHIKSLIDLNIFGATFGIGGEAIAPIPPLATRLVVILVIVKIFASFACSVLWTASCCWSWFVFVDYDLT